MQTWAKILVELNEDQRNPNKRRNNCCHFNSHLTQQPKPRTAAKHVWDSSSWVWLTTSGRCQTRKGFVMFYNICLTLNELWTSATLTSTSTNTRTAHFYTQSHNNTFSDKTYHAVTVGFSHVMCVFIRNVSCLYQDGLLVLQYGSMTIRYESKLLRYNPSKDMNRIDFISIESTLNFYFLVKIKWNNVTLSCRHNMYGQIQTTCSFWLIHIDELTHQNI